MPAPKCCVNRPEASRPRRSSEHPARVKHCPLTASPCQAGQHGAHSFRQALTAPVRQAAQGCPRCTSVHARRPVASPCAADYDGATLHTARRHHSNQARSNHRDTTPWVGSSKLRSVPASESPQEALPAAIRGSGSHGRLWGSDIASEPYSFTSPARHRSISMPSKGLSTAPRRPPNPSFYRIRT